VDTLFEELASSRSSSTGNISLQIYSWTSVIDTSSHCKTLSVLRSLLLIWWLHTCTLYSKPHYFLSTRDCCCFWRGVTGHSCFCVERAHIELFLLHCKHVKQRVGIYVGTLTKINIFRRVLIYSSSCARILSLQSVVDFFRKFATQLNMRFRKRVQKRFL